MFKMTIEIDNDKGNTQLSIDIDLTSTTFYVNIKLK